MKNIIGSLFLFCSLFVIGGCGLMDGLNNDNNCNCTCATCGEDCKCCENGVCCGDPDCKCCSEDDK